jgi:hypothetical protein
VDSDPPDWTRPDAFDAEIGACDDAYRQWRYIYERGMSAEKVSARFFGLIHLNQAIATEIDGYAEGVLIAGRSD